MGSILDNYRKQLEEDRLNESNEFDIPSFDDDIADRLSKNVDKKAVAEKVKELREDPNDMENQFKKFMVEYPRVTEDELDSKGSTFIDDDVKITIKRAYCPNCHKEIISKVPLLFNPYTMQKIAKYECSCGAKFNFEHSYPRIVYTNSKGEEIKAFTD
jgi:hypothetical protein